MKVGDIYLIEEYLFVLVSTYAYNTMNEFYCVVEGASSAVGGIPLPAGAVPGLLECTLINSYALHRRTKNKKKDIVIGRMEKKYRPFLVCDHELWWNGVKDRELWPYLDLYCALDDMDNRNWPW